MHSNVCVCVGGGGDLARHTRTRRPELCIMLRGTCTCAHGPLSRFHSHTDFGLAVDGNQERPVTRLGTLDYMAPEVCACVCLCV